MKRNVQASTAATLASVVTLALVSGCGHIQQKRCHYQSPPPPLPLGTYVDEVNQIQERNGEASDFVVYQHEFNMDTRILNMGGEDHVKQIAQRLHDGQHFPVIIERSMTTAREDTEHKFPVHPNPQLDLERRKVVVRALETMGIEDAEQRVVVAPALTPGFKDFEAERAYRQGFSGFGFGNGYGGFGGGFGFGGFGGGFGGFGGFF